MMTRKTIATTLLTTLGLLTLTGCGDDAPTFSDAFSVLGDAFGGFFDNVF